MESVSLYIWMYSLAQVAYESPLNGVRRRCPVYGMGTSKYKHSNGTMVYSDYTIRALPSSMTFPRLTYIARSELNTAIATIALWFSLNFIPNPHRKERAEHG